MREVLLKRENQYVKPLLINKVYSFPSLAEQE
jgi:hypothetical protein